MARQTFDGFWFARARIECPHFVAIVGRPAMAKYGLLLMEASIGAPPRSADANVQVCQCSHARHFGVSWHAESAQHAPAPASSSPINIRLFK